MLDKDTIFSNLTRQPQLPFNICMNTIYDMVDDILHCATIPATRTKVKSRAISIHLFRKKISFLSNYVIPIHEKNLTTRKSHAYLTDSQYNTCIL